MRLEDIREGILRRLDIGTNVIIEFNTNQNSQMMTQLLLTKQEKQLSCIKKSDGVMEMTVELDGITMSVRYMDLTCDAIDVYMKLTHENRKREKFTKKLIEVYNERFKVLNAWHLEFQKYLLTKDQ
jgi:hypothetical protein